MADVHLEMAEYYAVLVDETWAACPQLPFTDQDSQVMEFLLHAAEVHLKLRAAMLEPRVTVRNTTHADLSDVGRRDVPSSKGQPSQMELA